MFILVYILGRIKIVCWYCGIMVGGTAPSFYTAYNCDGWFGWKFKHRKLRKGGVT